MQSRFMTIELQPNTPSCGVPGERTHSLAHYATDSVKSQMEFKLCAHLAHSKDQAQSTYLQCFEGFHELLQLIRWQEVPNEVLSSAHLS